MTSPFLNQYSDADVDNFRASGEFDEQWYLREYPDVAKSGIDPARHYLWVGKAIGRHSSQLAYDRHHGIGLRWCIIATPHVLFVAQSLSKSLQRHGWSVEIVTTPPKQFDHDYYIVLCAQMFEVLPPGEKRIIYQLEQSASSRWFSEKYLQDLENSLAVLDYSLENIEFLEGKGICYPHVYYLPIGALQDYGDGGVVNKDIDVLFYGDFKSSNRRIHLLDSVSRKFNIHRVDSVFFEDMDRLIRRAKVVLNIHYYENAQLEMPRIQECLSLGVPVVSEDTSDVEDYPYLAGAVTFFRAGDVAAMERTLSSVLHELESTQDAIQAAVAEGERRTNFMVDRLLLGLSILPSEALGKFALEKVHEGEVFGLSLPETIKRRRIYNSEIKTPLIRTFDGIRHSPGWIGCGMSYKYLCESALRAGVSQFAIVEDDVLLDPEHDEKIRKVKDYLKLKSGDWDVFSGVIAHLHDHVNVLNVETFEGIDFVTVDKMTSMIFNIYGSRAINLISKWDQNNRDSDLNTIDRYLENSNLRVVVAHPYIAGHREELSSTLWGFQNTQYSDMIKESENKLGVLKQKWISENSVRA